MHIQCTHTLHVNTELLSKVIGLVNYFGCSNHFTICMRARASSLVCLGYMHFLLFTYSWIRLRRNPKELEFCDALLCHCVLVHVSMTGKDGQVYFGSSFQRVVAHREAVTVAVCSRGFSYDNELGSRENRLEPGAGITFKAPSLLPYL